MPRSNNEGRKYPRKKKGTASASKRIAPVACLNPFPVPSMEAVPHAYKASRDGLSFFTGHLTHHAVFFNLKDHISNPLPVDPQAWMRIRPELFQ